MELIGLAGYKKIIFLLLLLASGKLLYAQANSTIPEITSAINRKSIPLGEQFELKITYRYASAETLNSVPYVNDTFPHFEVIERQKADTSEQAGIRTVSQILVITSFDSGHWTIPPFVLTAGKKTYHSDTIGVDVQMVDLKGNTYNDIKEIIEVEEQPFNWLLWGGIFISVLVIGAGIWYYLKQRKKTPIIQRFDTRLSPLEQALQELEKLKQSKLHEKGEIKGFYSKAVEILKIFLERHVTPGFMQNTTDEILIKIKGGFADAGSFSSMAEVLRIADAVKFAKYGSSAEEAMQSATELEKSIRLLNQQKV